MNDQSTARVPTASRLTGSAILLAAAILLPRCSGANSTVTLTRADQRTANGASDPVASLRALADSTQADKPFDLAIADPTIAAQLAPHAQDDPRAWADLDTAIKTLQATYEPPPVRSTRPVTDRVLSEVGRLYRAAREKYLDGQFFESIRLLEQALKLDPGAVAAMRLLAQNHIATTGTTRAMQWYQKILTIQPDDVDALWRVGSDAWQRRKIDQAAANLGRAFKTIDGQSSDSRSRDLWLLTAHDLAQLLFDQGFDSAGTQVWSRFWKRLDRDGWYSIQHQNEIDRIHRRRAELETQHGDALSRLGRFEHAAARYESAAQIARPSQAHLMTRRVWVLCKTGQVARAMVLLLDALQDEETSRSAVDLMGSLASAPHSDLLQQAVRDQWAQHADDLRYVEAAAKLMPESRRDEVILEFLEVYGSSAKTIRQLLPWMIERLGTSAALRTIVDFARQTGQDTQELTRELVSLTDDPETLIDAFDQWPADVRARPTTRLVQARLLLQAHQLPQVRDAAQALHRDNPDDWPARLLLADTLIQLSLANEAQTLLIEPAPRSTDRIQWHYDRALLLARLGRIQAALDVLDDLERTFDIPSDQRATHLQRKARLYITAEQPNLAAQALQQAVQLDPANEDSYGPLMRLYGLGGPLQDADRFGAITRQLFAAAPASPTLTLLRAEQDAARGRFDDAIAACQALLTTDRANAPALRVLVGAWVQAGRASEAVQWLEAQLAARPGDAQWRNAWVQVLMADKQTARAVDYLKAVIEKYPYNLDAHRQLEQIYRSTGRDEEARRLTRARWQRLPESVAREMAFSEISLGDEDPAAALSHLKTAADLASHNLSDELENIVVQAARIAQADDELADQANQFAINIIEPLLDAGITLDRSTRLGYVNALIARDADVDRLRRAVDRSSADDIDAASQQITLAALVLTQLERVDDAVALADPWIDKHADGLDGDDAMLLHWRIVQTVLRNEPRRTIVLIRTVHAAGADLYQRIPALNPSDRDQAASVPLAESLYRIAVQFTIAEHDDSQETVLAAALKADPDHALANNDLGYSLADRDERLDEAQAMLVKAVLAQPEKSEFLDSLGWVRYKLGQLNDAGELVHEHGAVSLLEQAAQFRPAQSANLEDSPVVLDHLGDAYWRAGRPDDAVSAWQHAVGAYETMVRNAQAIAQQGGPETVELITQYYGPVTKTAQSKIDAVNAQTRPPVAPSPALDENPPPDP